MRMTCGGRESRESSTRSTMPKFEFSSSGGTHRSSVNHTVAWLQSASRSAAMAYALRGVEPPVRTMWPPCSATAVSRSATAAPGSSTTEICLMRGCRLRDHLARGGERRLVGGIAQQCLPHALAEDARLAPRRAEDGPLMLGAVARAPHGLEPARPAVERDRRARGHLDRHAGQAGRAGLLHLVQADRDLAPPGPRVPAAPLAAAVGERARAPAQPGAHPAAEQ